jgi:cytochrome c-type biogenesis protein CcmE
LAFAPAGAILGNLTEVSMQARYILGVGLILGALMVASVVTYSREAVAYYTVDELYEKAGVDAVDQGPLALAGSPLSERPLQVRGEVDYTTVDRGEDGLQMKFHLTGKNGHVPVVYQGLVPDTFDQAESVTVGGRLDADGALAADELFVQCPSKYEAMPPGLDAVEGGHPDGKSSGDYSGDYGALDGASAPGDDAGAPSPVDLSTSDEG